MAKKAHIDLSNPAKRDALKPRSSYYAHALGSKRYVLMRKGARGAVWGARVPGQADKALGPVEDMDFDQVADLVRQMSDDEQVAADVNLTIGDAVDAYVAACEKTKSKQSVRRQGFWDQWRPKLRESLAHLIGLIMRRAGGDASAALRVSSV